MALRPNQIWVVKLQFLVFLGCVLRGAHKVFGEILERGWLRNKLGLASTSSVVKVEKTGEASLSRIINLPRRGSVRCAVTMGITEQIILIKGFLERRTRTTRIHKKYMGNKRLATLRRKGQ